MLNSSVSRFCSTKLKPLSLTALFLTICTFGLYGQSRDSGARNNPFSPSPPRKTKPAAPVSGLAESGLSEVSFVMQPSEKRPIVEDRPTIAQTTFTIPKNPDSSAMPATEVYKVGVGDVLLISLENATHGSGYYTVRPDGTIDFPLAGENVIVADQTTENIGEILAAGIKIYRSAQVAVKVREYASHKITVSGMVDRAGERSLQREALPLFAVRAEAGVDSRATKVYITRTPRQNRETYALSDSKTDNVLIYPGNTVEFTADGDSPRPGGGTFYFVSGAVASPGQREMTEGLTLYQAVIASGGPKGNPKQAIIRRKNNAGVLVSFEHNLRSIKAGKSQDPALVPGDVIEIKN